MSSFIVVNTRYADGVYQSAALELPDNLSRYATGDTVHRPVIRKLIRRELVNTAHQYVCLRPSR